MCGIFCILNNNSITPEMKEGFIKGTHRGPEHSVINYNESLKFTLGFHRLAINGLNVQSNQPIEQSGIIVICNGEIYNYKELYKKNNITPITDSDCEAIIHMYLLYGMEYTLNALDGVFAFILIDTLNNVCFAARDPFGVRPLYTTYHDTLVDDSVIEFASELKQLRGDISKDKHISSFPPGSYQELYFENNKWFPKCPIVRYHNFSFLTICQEPEMYQKGICYYLNEAVKKRTLVTERPVACLLSGGLDSSLIAALVKKHYNGVLETYSIGLPGSEDLKYAELVANHIGSKHTSIQVTEEEFFDAIPDVIRDIESYDTTTVRASVGNWLIGKYISENSEAKVIFNGDGADELMGGYLYFNKAPNSTEFDCECKRLLKEIYRYDVLRSDKCISSHGLEPRTPFLDRGWVQYYLSIPSNIRFHINHNAAELNNCEKFLTRMSIARQLPSLLPDEVLWRTKEAFSDGVSSLTKSWYEIIQERVNFLNIDKTYEKLSYDHNNPTTPEQKYYRHIFEKIYKGNGNIIPHFWMPNYVNASDASARTLSFYNICGTKTQI